MINVVIFSIILKIKENLHISIDPIIGALVSIDGEEFISDADGKLKFSLVLNGSNYDRLRRLKVFEGDILIAQKDTDFFTETPILIIKD